MRKQHIFSYSFSLQCESEKSIDCNFEKCSEKSTIFLDWFPTGLKRSLCIKHFENYYRESMSPDVQIIPENKAKMRMALE